MGNFWSTIEQRENHLVIKKSEKSIPGDHEPRLSSPCSTASPLQTLKATTLSTDEGGRH
jgi:hypothetical protein